MKVNPKVAVEYHQPRALHNVKLEGSPYNPQVKVETSPAGFKIFSCLQMRGEAKVFNVDDPRFDEGLKIFKPEIEIENIKRGMDMTRFTPQEILFYDVLKKRED